MDANIVNLRALFQKPVSYRIPQFQRPYAWGEDVQWKPLWDDIRNVALRVLNKKEDEKIRPHFLGAIVLQQQKSNTDEVTKRLVVDGQQRLTTLQLLIKATENVFQSQDDTVRAVRLRELTANQESYWGGDSHNETKIRQCNINDQRAFQEAMRTIYSDTQRQSWAISQAYRYLKVLAEDWLDGAPDERTSRADALEEVLTKHLQMAVIDLDEDEKPHIIFETLNARAEPLRQSDLIKNTVMYEANVMDEPQQASKLWGMFDDGWWRENTDERGRDRFHIDRFLNYWVIIRALREVSPDRVASVFRNYIETRNKPGEQSSIEYIVADIRNTGKIYKDLEKIRVPGIDTFLERMKTMGLGVVTPLLLWLYTSNMAPVKIRVIIDVLESYLVRRMLCGLRSNSLSQVFITLLTLLERLSPENRVDVDRTTINYLMSQTGDGQLWPNDRMLKDRLTSNPMQGNNSRKTLVFEAIERHLRGDGFENCALTRDLTLEHIMPKSWQRHWPLSPGRLNHDEAETVRNEAQRNIGNLTLTTEKLSASLSNGPWNEKRLTLANHNILFLNRMLLDNAPDAWDEEAIERRSQFLADKIMEIWPSADTFAESAA